MKINLIKSIKQLNINQSINQSINVIDRIICLLCVYICHYIFPFYYLDIFFLGHIIGSISVIVYKQWYSLWQKHTILNDGQVNCLSFFGSSCIQMTTAVSQRLNVICIKFKIIVFFISFVVHPVIIQCWNYTYMLYKTCMTTSCHQEGSCMSKQLTYPI